MPPQPALQPVFYYDLASAWCYLAAERVMGELPVAPEWEPVLGAELGEEPEKVDRDELALVARRWGLQPLRWPPQTADGRPAALAATYAKQIGRAVAFSLACFRQAFAGGRDPGDIDTLVLAGAACEIHPSALLRGVELRSVQDGLARANARAREAGVTRLPALAIGSRTFEGVGAVELAARELGAAA